MPDSVPTFDTSVIELISKRKSHRNYNDKPIENEKRTKLQSFMENTGVGPFANCGRFDLVVLGLPGKGRIGGTYGMIKGASSFLVGTISSGPQNMEDFGYLFELVILRATDLGLSTCWLGATLNRSLFENKINATSQEIVPAVSPVGYCTKRRSLTDTVARISVGAKNRKPWSELFFFENFSCPLPKDQATDFGQCLEMVRLGPSASNRQPWRIVKSQGRFDFYVLRTPGISKITSATDMQRIDMGIAMCHFELTARHLKLPGFWEQKKTNLASLPRNTEYVVSWVI